jgi:hypothetical protein
MRDVGFGRNRGNWITRNGINDIVPARQHHAKNVTINQKKIQNRGNNLQYTARYKNQFIPKEQATPFPRHYKRPKTKNQENSKQQKTEAPNIQKRQETKAKKRR